jgi:hypothetical protein
MHWNKPSTDPLLGRSGLLDEVVSSLRKGRIFCLRGGRGMGKTSFAMKVKNILETEHELETRLILLPEGDDLEKQKNQLSPEMDKLDVLIMDEADIILEHSWGKAFYRWLAVYQQNRVSPLGILVVGGAKLDELRYDYGSPFFRVAIVEHLKPLSEENVGELLSYENLSGMNISARTVIKQLGGHPLLIRIFCDFLRQSPETVLPFQALEDCKKNHFDTLFRTWWDSFTDGQKQAFVILLKQGGFMPEERLDAFGPDPFPSLWLLEATGVIRLTGPGFYRQDIIIECLLFAYWLEEARIIPRWERPLPKEIIYPEGLDKEVSFPKDGPCDRLTKGLNAINNWADGVLQFPGACLTKKTGMDKVSLLQENTIRDNCLIALSMKEIIAFSEVARKGGFSDTVLPLSLEEKRNLIVEFKIWPRNDYEKVVSQVLSYGTKEDFFAIVMISRQAESITAKYHDKCLQNSSSEKIFPMENQGPLSFVSTHIMEGVHVPVFHFLVNLPIR